MAQQTGIEKSGTRQLAKYETDALSKLSPEYQVLIRAKHEKKIALYTENEQIEYMKVIVKELMIHIQSNHLQLSSEQLETMILTFAVSAVGELKQIAGKLTMSEAKIALREGYRGAFGFEVFGLSAVNFGKCFRAYDNWEKRLEAQKAFNKEIEEPTTDKPVIDMFPKNMENAIACFETFKAEPKLMSGTVSSSESGTFHLPTVFNFLVDNFDIPFSAETKKIVLDKAKRDYWDFMKSGLSRQEIKDGKLQQLINTVKLDNNRTFEYYCDAEGLRVLFTKLIERNKTLTDLKKKV